MLEIFLTSVNESRKDSDASKLETWIAGAAEKDTQALENLYHHTKTAVYGFALSILKNTHDAEDALHDCYVQVYLAAGTYQAHGKPMAWILTITRNLCLKKLAQAGKTQPLPEEDWRDSLESCTTIQPEDKAFVEACMEKLPDQERQIIILHALAGFKHREIAQMLQLPLPTVLSKYHRGIQKLRTLVKGG